MGHVGVGWGGSCRGGVGCGGSWSKSVKIIDVTPT